MNDYTTISFPGLGLELNPHPEFSVGPLTVRMYGVLIATGLLLAVFYAWKRCKQFGIKQDDITDGVLWVAPFAILCARLFYCIFEWDQYASNPISVFYIWKGGLAIAGGILGAIAGVAVYCHFKKIKMAALLDLLVLGFLIGQIIGRWGNFFNREAFGGETDIFIRMGLLNSVTGTVTYHHPTFLYESLWNAVGFAALHFLSKKRQYDGQIALGYALWYGFGRMLIEGLRTDSLWLGPFRINQLLAGASFIAAAVVLIIQLRRTHTPEKLFVNQVAALQAESVEEAEEEESIEEDAAQ